MGNHASHVLSLSLSLIPSRVTSGRIGVSRNIPSLLGKSLPLKETALITCTKKIRNKLSFSLRSVIIDNITHKSWSTYATQKEQKGEAGDGLPRHDRQQDLLLFHEIQSGRCKERKYFRSFQESESPAWPGRRQGGEEAAFMKPLTSFCLPHITSDSAFDAVTMDRERHSLAAASKEGDDT